MRLLGCWAIAGHSHLIFAAYLFFVGCSSGSEKVIQGDDIFLYPKIVLSYEGQSIVSKYFEEQLGTKFQNEKVVKTLTIENQGDATLSIRLDSPQVGIRVSEEFPLQIPAREVKSIEFEFITAEVALVDHTLVFVTNDPVLDTFFFRFHLSVRTPFDLVSSKDGTALTVSNREIESFDITPDGKWAVFVTAASNLHDQATNGCTQVYLKSLTNLAESPVLISSNENAAGNGSSYGAKLSADGKSIFFLSRATNLTNYSLPLQGTDTGCRSNIIPQIYRKNLEAGELRLVSLNIHGQPSSSGALGLIESASDGRRLAFQSQAKDLISGIPEADNTFRQQIYLWTEGTGMELLSSKGGGWSNRSKGPLLAAASFVSDFQLSFSALGFILEPQTEAQIYRRNGMGQIQAPLSTFPGKFSSPVTSSNGKYLLFTSDSAELKAQITGQGGDSSQTYVLDVDLDIIDIVSATAGVSANQASRPLSVTDDGKLILFASNATNLKGEIGSNEQIFLRNRMGETLELISSKDGSSEYVADLVDSGELSLDGEWAFMIASSLDFMNVIAAGKQLYRKKLTYEGR